ncbi:serine/threonine protein kinase [Hyalangium rubrum]|uniref:Protein kinase n=1 Tax=Hyalangium rubrum TaxID=3103134 RepID=A0ABU5H1M2_9BACT|nr:protein kinase [Hyalangium sp. s54d21]MDY7227348.1 protein kinase [Hyalangium sp. s54d21]
MESSAPPELNPTALPPGTRVGSWQVKGWGGRGTYGTVYRAVKAEGEAGGLAALKLAIHWHDARFEREVELLGRIHHPHVPRLLGHGRWRHPSGVTYPYLVMEWVEGIPLYEWAVASNPSSRQALALLAQVARALEATHAVGGVHRDVKGENVLVRRADDQAFLLDFGAGHCAGSATLTHEVLPPGTPAYRSPEAWRFAQRYFRLPNAHYAVQPADDVFALGVTAWRLVTDRYPPPTDPGEEGASRCWYQEGGLSQSPRALNPRVEARLEALILRMLSVRPQARGTARELAEALELTAAQAGPEADVPLFDLEALGRSKAPTEKAVAPLPPPGEPKAKRVPGRGGAEARVSAERREAERARATTEQVAAREPVWPWFGAGLAAALGLLLTGELCASGLRRLEAEQHPVAQEEPDAGERDGGVVGLADTVPAATMAELKEPSHGDPIGLPMPESPFRAQRRAPHCRPPLEAAINDGCWIRLADVKPPCRDMGYEWKGSCYLPSYQPPRAPTSERP